MPVNKTKPIEVRPAKNSTDWEVARQGESQPMWTYRTQVAAEDIGRRTARREGTAFILKGRDGRVRSRANYGKPTHGAAAQANLRPRVALPRG
jgi:Uncharacterized protein conserved in bacteria (DUF2188)